MQYHLVVALYKNMIFITISKSSEIRKKEKLLPLTYFVFDTKYAKTFLQANGLKVWVLLLKPTAKKCIIHSCQKVVDMKSFWFGITTSQSPIIQHEWVRDNAREWSESGLVGQVVNFYTIALQNIFSDLSNNHAITRW